MLDNLIEYTLTIKIEGEGKVSPKSGSKYKKDTVVELTVTPEEGSEFKGWSGSHGAEVTDNKIKMNGDKSIKAIFAKKEDKPGNGDQPDDPGNDDQPDEPGNTPLSDDYYGFTDNARRLYKAVVEGEEEGEEFTFHGNVDIRYEVIIDDPNGISVIKETIIETINIDGEERTTEYLHYIGKKKVNNEYRYYYLNTEDEETGEKSYDLNQADHDGNIMFVAPLTVEEENPMGKVEAYEDVRVDAGSFKAYRVIIQDDGRARSTIWVVPDYGIIKNLQEYKDIGITYTLNLVSCS